eukprot:CAMPEP_0206548856 /NCGR_PEP_ID=MMETSP0325_2-20121206/14125_1 /ASSEMBLY_ACC=CAM_ASM_000347 /TAXON_ID=2866 /ORGANISM="Crypthecodinium cohnii, Strain Seligo" /LENGTH=33 /DNA_ID= /DNA_START= /DNA_END= /DNA_ORIENTATION=
MTTHDDHHCQMGGPSGRLYIVHTRVEVCPGLRP